MGGRFGELLLILIIALLLFGPNKLPSLAKALGEALKEFKKAADPNNQDNAKPATSTALPPEGHGADKKEG
jgi:sec-independent protein translocase protein TatA